MAHRTYRVSENSPGDRAGWLRHVQLKIQISVPHHTVSKNASQEAARPVAVSARAAALRSTLICLSRSRCCCHWAPAAAAWAPLPAPLGDTAPLLVVVDGDGRRHWRTGSPLNLRAKRSIEWRRRQAGCGQVLLRPSLRGVALVLPAPLFALGPQHLTTTKGQQPQQQTARRYRCRRTFNSNTETLRMPTLSALASVASPAGRNSEPKLPWSARLGCCYSAARRSRPGGRNTQVEENPLTAQGERSSH